MSDEQSSTAPDSPTGWFLRALTLAAGVRVLAVDATPVAEETRQRHGLGARAARLAAEGLVSAQLMSAHIGGEERLTLQVQGEQPRFALAVDVNADGSTRARFTPPRVPAHKSIRGMLFAIKHDAERELYRGVAPVEDTDFQGALQGYLEKSQQSVGVVRIHTEMDGPGHVRFAGGLLVEKLPDMEVELFHELFDSLAEAELMALLDDVTNDHLMGLPLEVIEKRRVRFHCPCSLERARSILQSLGTEEVQSLLDEQGQGEMTCNFCSERYVVSGAELQAMINADKKPGGA